MPERGGSGKRRCSFRFVGDLRVASVGSLFVFLGVNRETDWLTIVVIFYPLGETVEQSRNYA